MSDRRNEEEERESLRDGYEADLAAAHVRLDELKGMDSPPSVLKAAQDRIKDAEREIKHLGGERQETASKRPRTASGKQTR